MRDGDDCGLLDAYQRDWLARVVLNNSEGGSLDVRVEHDVFFGEVFLDQELVLLLIPRGENQVSLRRQVPVELLEPKGLPGLRLLLLRETLLLALDFLVGLLLRPLEDLQHGLLGLPLLGNQVLSSLVEFVHVLLHRLAVVDFDLELLFLGVLDLDDHLVAYEAHLVDHQGELVSFVLRLADRVLDQVADSHGNQVVDDLFTSR